MTSDPVIFLMGAARFVSETVDGHRTRIVELDSSALNALGIESHSVVEVLRSTESRGTIPSANRDPPAQAPVPYL